MTASIARMNLVLHGVEDSEIARGDTLAALETFGVQERISYVSTGGGAFLEYVEGRVLPAVEILEQRARSGKE